LGEEEKEEEVRQDIELLEEKPQLRDIELNDIEF
jgi:hypothetical protein